MAYSVMYILIKLKKIHSQNTLHFVSSSEQWQARLCMSVCLKSVQSPFSLFDHEQFYSSTKSRFIFCFPYFYKNIG